jgi:hypothetical protein
VAQLLRLEAVLALLRRLRQGKDIACLAPWWLARLPEFLYSRFSCRDL